MHEASLVQGLLGMVEKALHDYSAVHSDNSALRIKEIRCSYGLLACFEPETLQACFELLSEDSVAAGATLLLELEPLACKCSACNNNFDLHTRAFRCPVCGGEQIAFSGGNGLTLLAIDVEEE